MADMNSPRMQAMAKLTHEELLARIAELESAPKRAANSLSYKVGEKGGISIYGTGRFPTTNYAETWVRITQFTTGLDMDAIKETPIGQFILDHRDELSFKNGIKEWDIPASQVNA